MIPVVFDRPNLRSCAMKLNSDRLPTEREQEIYQVVHVDGVTQAVAAQRFGVSQSAISKICTRVAQWLATTRPGRGLTLEHQIWLSLSDATQKAQHNRMLAAQAFQESFKPHIAIITRTNKDGETTEERRVMQPKINHHMYDRMCQHDAEIVDLLRRTAEAEQVALDQTKTFVTYREDYFARRGKKYCLDALKSARNLRKRGIAVPAAPRFLRREIEQYVRAKTRELPQSKKVLDFLPPNWLAFVKAIESDPAVYVDSLQSKPEVAETFEMSPKPVVEYTETIAADMPTDDSAVTTESHSETPAVVAVCAASEDRKPTEQADEPARNNFVSAPPQKPKSQRTYPADDPFQYALPVLRVTRVLPGQRASDWARQQRAKGS